jgi:RND family efflux transporter MFP subunit
MKATCINPTGRERCTVGVALVLFVALSTGCRKGDERNATGPKPGNTPPPIAVDTIVAIEREVVDHRVFTGRTVAAHSVEIRTRVGGTIVQSPSRNAGIVVDSEWKEYLRSLPQDDPANFVVTAREGMEVQKGTPLFQIDPRPFQTALAQAQGNLAALEAQRKRFRAERMRVESLLANKTISETEYELTKANDEEALGQIETLKASVERAKLELASTKIVAPIDGIVGRALIMEGNVVSANSDILTTVISRAPIHVYFDVDENSFLKYRTLLQEDQLRRDDKNRVQVRMALSGDEDFPHEGAIDFQNNTTDPNSGNTLLRAEFDNSQGRLSPGLYCRVRVPYSARYNAILIPTKCLATSQKGRYVLVVNGAGKIEERSIVLGTTHGQFTAIAQGLHAGDIVVYEGLQKVRPGSAVQATPSKETPSFVGEAEGS